MGTVTILHMQPAGPQSVCSAERFLGHLLGTCWLTAMFVRVKLILALVSPVSMEQRCHHSNRRESQFNGLNV
jgi:hypothetical protein